MCYFGKVSCLWRVTSEKYHVIDLLLIQVTHLWCVTFWLLTSSGKMVQHSLHWQRWSSFTGCQQIDVNLSQREKLWGNDSIKQRERETKREDHTVESGAFSLVMLAGCIGSFFSCFNMTLGSFSSLLALLLHLSLFDSISFRGRALLHCGRAHFHHGVNRPQKNVNSKKWVFSAGAQAVLHNGAGMCMHQRTKNFSTRKECQALYWKTHFLPFLV